MNNRTVFRDTSGKLASRMSEFDQMKKDLRLALEDQLSPVVLEPLYTDLKNLDSTDDEAEQLLHRAKCRIDMHGSPERVDKIMAIFEESKERYGDVYQRLADS